MVSAKLRCECKPVLVEIYRKHPRAAVDAKRLHSQKADHPRADDHGGAALAYAREFGRMHRDRDCLDQCRFLEGKALRQLIHDVFRNRNKLGEGSVPAILAARDAEYLALVAKVYLASRAERASTTGDRGIEGHTITRAEG